MARREYPGVYPYPAAGGRTLYRAFYTDSSGVPRQKRGFTSPSAAAKFRSRMQVRTERGELRISVPIGYIWHREIGLGLDPDRRIQEAIRLIFSRFRELGSARQVLRKRSLTPTLHRKR